MAKKRKLTPKSSQAQRQKQQKQEQEQQQQQQQQQLLQQVSTQQVHEEDVDEDEVEEEAEFDHVGGGQGAEEEEDDEDEEEEEDEEDEATKNQNSAGDDDGEPFHKLLEPFTKELLVNMLCEAAEKHPQVAARVRKIADEDPVHRKIFVHGLGWDTTTETLRSAFAQYGEIEDCKAVVDKVTGKSKGYGFILFKSRSGAYKALQQPQKKIGNRMTACQLASVGPVPASGAAGGTGQAVVPQQPVSEYTKRKIYVSNVGADLDPQKLYNFFAEFGEIEEGPLGLDKQTGKPKGFCLFVYKNVESAREALEEPHKNFEGHILHCQKAIDGPKYGKQQQNQQRNPIYGRNDNQNYGGSVGGAAGGAAGQMLGQSVSTIPFNQGGAATAAPPALNPALGQALTALLASQGGLGLHNLLGSLGTAGVGAAPAVPGAGHGIQGSYGNQAVGSSISPGVLGGYGTQAGLQSAYPNQQQGGSRTQHGAGHIGGVAPYSGH